jgi:hypothetical protein
MAVGALSGGFLQPTLSPLLGLIAARRRAVVTLPFPSLGGEKYEVAEAKEKDSNKKLAFLIPSLLSATRHYHPSSVGVQVLSGL